MHKNLQSSHAVVRDFFSARDEESATGPKPYTWLAAALNAMCASGNWATALTPNTDVIIPQAFPLNLVDNRPAALLTALNQAVQGAGAKLASSALWPTPAANTTIDLSTVSKTFGVRVRITNSVLNFKYGLYSINLLNNATVIGTVQVMPQRCPIDIVMLAIETVGGRASVITNPSTKVQFLAADNPSLVAGSDMLVAETLNMRDIAGLTVRNGVIDVA